MWSRRDRRRRASTSEGEGDAGCLQRLAAEGGKGVSAAKLYNLKEDIGESKDLMASQPEKARELQSAWDRWNKDNVAPLWGQEAKLPKK